MADIAKCENKDCTRALQCYRFTAEASSYRQTYMMEMKDRCEGDGYKYWIPNYKGEKQVEN